MSDACEELVDALGADDATALVGAIERASEALARGELAGDRADVVGRAIVAHARHARSKVRQAVAEALRDLPEEAFEAGIGPLLEDASVFVKRAATRSYDEKSRARRVESGREERSATMRDLRAQIADEYKAGALRAADRLSELELGQFVERLHHELAKVTTPLKCALAELRAEARSVGGGDRGKIAAHADEAHRTLVLLSGMIDAARSHARVVAPKFRDENVRALVEEQVGLLRARTGDERRARLRVGVAIDEGIAAEVDRVLVAQAVSNLLQNAVEAYAGNGAGSEAGEAPIAVEVRGEWRMARTVVAITVEDRGGGIAEDSLAHIGEPFVSTKGVGRGLGMLNVKNVVERVHGGSVEVESEAGKGTRVTIAVPRRQGE